MKPHALASMNHVMNLLFFPEWRNFDPPDLLEGDSGWVPVPCRHQFEMLKLWHHLATMDDSRLTKRFLSGLEH